MDDINQLAYSEEEAKTAPKTKAVTHEPVLGGHELSREARNDIAIWLHNIGDIATAGVEILESLAK
ncbi:MAG: hypothetical protein LBM12_01125 [Candidatus Nomurabacteria bacterium]|jgi:hypothetical protein|nr:hypothetical protein [Candidatus Nomurabacteria bacterium]